MTPVLHAAWIHLSRTLNCERVVGCVIDIHDFVYFARCRTLLRWMMTSRDGSNVRVLIVDDQDYIRRGLKALLTEQPGIVVCGEAVNGSDAIDKANRLRPDVVIMDISMPIVDGLRATRVIRRLLPKIEVITLSQYELSDLSEVLEAGARTHVPKLAIWDALLPALRALPVQ
jgi:CheY-like chemotaxis protein